MRVAHDEVERRVELMKDALRGRGMRLTHQRIEVAREIAAADDHPDVERIYENVRVRVPTISLDTVYRTMATLVELGCVTRATLAAGPARYDANVTHHHHFVCTRCGVARDVDDPSFDAVRTSEGTTGLGTVESVEVRLRGVCAQCEPRGGAGTPRARHDKESHRSQVG